MTPLGLGIGSSPVHAQSNGLPFRYAPGITAASLGGTFARTSPASYIDQNGILQTAPSGTLREWANYIGGVPTTLLEPAATNLVVQSRAFGTAPWIMNGVIGASQNAIGVDGTANSAWTLPLSGVNQWLYQPITGQAGVQCTFSIWAKGSGTTQVIFYDNISTFQATTITLTNTLTRYTITKTFGAGATDMRVGIGNATVGTATSVVADAAQLEVGVLSTSYIATVAATVTRNADSLSIPWLAIPQPLTLYMSLVELGTLSLTGTAGYLEMGGPLPYFVLWNNAAFLRISHRNSTVQRDGDLGTGLPTIGQAAEFRAILNADGSARASASVNGSAEQLGAQTAANTLAPAWGAQVIRPNGGTVVPVGCTAIKSIKIAFGIRDLATMRAA